MTVEEVDQGTAVAPAGSTTTELDSSKLGARMSIPDDGSTPPRPPASSATPSASGSAMTTTATTSATKKRRSMGGAQGTHKTPDRPPQRQNTKQASILSFMNASTTPRSKQQPPSRHGGTTPTSSLAGAAAKTPTRSTAVSSASPQSQQQETHLPSETVVLASDHVAPAPPPAAAASTVSRLQQYASQLTHHGVSPVKQQRSQAPQKTPEKGNADDDDVKAIPIVPLLTPSKAPLKRRVFEDEEEDDVDMHTTCIEAKKDDEMGGDDLTLPSKEAATSTRKRCATMNDGLLAAPQDAAETISVPATPTTPATISNGETPQTRKSDRPAKRSRSMSMASSTTTPTSAAALAKQRAIAAKEEAKRKEAAEKLAAKLQKEKEKEAAREAKEREKEALREAKEKERQEKEAQREKERLAKEEVKRKENEAKEAVRREKEEARLKELEEKEKKKQEKQQEKDRLVQMREQEILKKQQAQSRLLNFFSKTEAGPPSPLTDEVSPFDKLFPPFHVREDVFVSPITRFLTTAHPNLADEWLTDHLGDVQKPRWQSGAMPARAKPLGGMSDELRALLPPAASSIKLLHFHENYRPAYYGTMNLTTHTHATRAMAKAPLKLLSHLDYEVDSADEWEDEEDGDECDDEGEEDEDQEMEGDVDRNEAGGRPGAGGEDGEEEGDDWLVPDGYLSEEEMDEDEAAALTSSAQPAPSEEKKKVKPLVPIILGPFDYKTNDMATSLYNDMTSIAFHALPSLSTLFQLDEDGCLDPLNLQRKAVPKTDENHDPLSAAGDGSSTNTTIAAAGAGAGAGAATAGGAVTGAQTKTQRRKSSSILPAQLEPVKEDILVKVIQDGHSGIAQIINAYRILHANASKAAIQKMVDIVATKEKYVGAKKPVYVLRTAESRRAYEAAMAAMAAADNMQTAVAFPSNQTKLTALPRLQTATSSTSSLATTPQKTSAASSATPTSASPSTRMDLDAPTNGTADVPEEAKETTEVTPLLASIHLPSGGKTEEKVPPLQT